MSNEENKSQDNESNTENMCDTPKCKCGGRTALISGMWYFRPDEEPYMNGIRENSKICEGEEWIIGYKCDECAAIIDLFADDRDGYQSRITELEAENRKLREALEEIMECMLKTLHNGMQTEPYKIARKVIYGEA